MSITVRRTEDVSFDRQGVGKHRRSTLEELLFQLGLGDLDLHSLINLLCMTTPVVGVILDGRGEESINESGFSKT